MRTQLAPSVSQLGENPLYVDEESTASDNPRDPNVRINSGAHIRRVRTQDSEKATKGFKSSCCVSGGELSSSDEPYGPFSLPDQFRYIKYKGGKKKITSVAKQHQDGDWMDFLIDSGSDAHMVPIGMFDAPVIPKASGNKVKFELANGKTIDSAGTNTGMHHKEWTCFQDSVSCCPSGKAYHIIRIAIESWS